MKLNHVPQFDESASYFPETGHSLRGKFLEYWNTHGGLALYGYPLSEEFQESNPDDGKTYTVQYFERNRFEYHPELAGTKYEVLLGRLGALLGTRIETGNTDAPQPIKKGQSALGGKITINGITKEGKDNRGVYIQSAIADGLVYWGVVNPNSDDLSQNKWDLWDQKREERVANGFKTRFSQGDAVWGDFIVLDSGQGCLIDCFLPIAPTDGYLVTGKINPTEDLSHHNVWGVLPIKRQETGGGQCLDFGVGFYVYGYQIKLNAPGETITKTLDKGIYLAGAGSTGTVCSGVILNQPTGEFQDIMSRMTAWSYVPDDRDK